MPEVVKSVPNIIIALVVFLIILFLIFVILGIQSQKKGEPPLKLGRGICKFVTGLFFKILEFGGLVVKLTEQGVMSSCDLLPF
ncbi:MAG: hypothetical protein QXD43_06140 [Candidatus Aenigmatarchaeota archaeon]